MARSGVLLDTCAAIWLIDGEPLVADGAQALLDAAGVAFVSAMTAWEFGLLVSRGRLRWPIPPLAVFNQLIDGRGLQVLPTTPEILVAASFLPGLPPRDPQTASSSPRLVPMASRS